MVGATRAQWGEGKEKSWVARASVRLSITARDVDSLGLLCLASTILRLTIESDMADTEELDNAPANKRSHSAVDGNDNGELRICQAPQLCSVY